MQYQLPLSNAFWKQVIVFKIYCVTDNAYVLPNTKKTDQNQQYS